MTVGIDIHAHVVPSSYVDALGKELPDIAPKLSNDGGEWYMTYPSGRRAGPMPVGMFDTESRIADMDRQGLRMQALSVPPGNFMYALEDGTKAATIARLHNDAMVEMAKEYPDRFTVLGTLPLQDPAASIVELERLSEIAAVTGLEFGTNVDGMGFDDPSLRELWTAVARVGMSVVLHPNNFECAPERMHSFYMTNFVGNPTDSTMAAGALMFGGVLTANPTLRIVLLHGGGFLPYQIGRFDHGWKVRPEPREHLKTSPREMLSRFYFDTLTHDPDSLRFLLQRVGADRVCLGSDYPFDMADMDPVRTVQSVVTDARELKAILEDTPLEILTRRPA